MKTAARVAQEKEKTIPLFYLDASAAKLQKTQKHTTFYLSPGSLGALKNNQNWPLLENLGNSILWITIVNPPY